ncbi:MAG: hypothetical protein ACYC2T_15840 [Bacillota bacterium]
MPSFVLQLISFFQAALTWITALAIPATALTAGYHALMRATAQDEMSAMNHGRALRNAFIYGAIVILAGGITSAVMGAFK